MGVFRAADWHSDALTTLDHNYHLLSPTITHPHCLHLSFSPPMAQQQLNLSPEALTALLQALSALNLNHQHSFLSYLFLLLTLSHSQR